MDANVRAPDPLAPLHRRLDVLDYLHMDKPEFQARLQRRGAVYFAAHGPAVAHAAFEMTAPYDRVWVVAVEGDMARIQHQVTHGLLLLWLPREDLMEVIGEEVRLVHAPGDKAAPDGIGVTVFPGAALSRHESRDGFTEVQHDDIIFYFHGWVPGGVFRDIYRMTGPERPLWVRAEGDFAHEGDLHPGAMVYDRPNGRVIAVAGRNRQRHVYANESDVEGWWLMEFNNIEFRIRGYVSDFNVDEHKPGSGYGVGGGRGRGNRVIATVPANTCFLDRPDGEIVGRTLSDQTLAIAAEPDGGYRVETDSMGWGTVSVFLQPDSTEVGDDGLPTLWLDCSASI